jgi:hypothetical protein
MRAIVVRHTFRYAAPFLLMTAMTAGVALAADDPFIGKWQLDRAHSKYEAGDIPQSMTITMEETDRGIHYVSESTYGNGRQSKVTYTAKYDGIPASVEANGGLMAPVALTRVNPTTVEAKYEHGLKTVATATRVVSNDGATMTITTTEKIPQKPKEGKPKGEDDEVQEVKKITNVTVFHRLKDL